MFVSYKRYIIISSKHIKIAANIYSHYASL